MADDRMRLIAELTNKVSDPVRQMSRDVTAFAKTAQQVNQIFGKLGKELGVQNEQVRKHNTEHSRMTREFERFRDVIKKVVPQFGELNDQFAELAVGGGTVIGMLGAVGIAAFETTKQVGEFAEAMRSLKFASRETGMTLQQLRNMQIAAEEFGISADQMTTSMNNFADSMVRIHQRDAGFLQSIRPAAKYTQEILKLGFAGASTSEELEAVGRAMDRIKREHPGVQGEQMARNFAKMFGLDPALARLSSHQREELLAEINKYGSDPYKLKEAEHDAEEFNRQILISKSIFDGWRVALMSGILPPLTEAIKLFNELVSNPMFKKAMDVGSSVVGTVAPYVGRALIPGGIGAGVSETVKSFMDQHLHRSGVPWTAQGIPKFGDGAIVTQPTRALVGEKGPEAVIPLTGGGFDPFTKMQMLLEDLFGMDYSTMPSIVTARGGGGGAYYGGGGNNRSFNEFIARRGGSGAGPLFRPGVGPRARGGGGSGGMRGTVGTESDNPSASLAEGRQRMMKELNDNPRLKDFAINAMRHEGGLQSNFEQLMNYAAMRHMTINQALHSGQYGPVNTGQISAAISPKLRSEGEAALARVGQGSNITDYSTDQGMRGDPNFAKYMANRPYYNMHQVEGAWFSYHGERGRAWAERQRKADSEAQQRQVEDAKARAAMSQTNKTSVEGTGSIDVKVSAPPGTDVSGTTSGLFKKMNIERNIQMAPASAGPTDAATFNERFGSW